MIGEPEAHYVTRFRQTQVVLRAAPGQKKLDLDGIFENLSGSDKGPVY